MISFISYITIYYWDEQIKKAEMMGSVVHSLILFGIKKNLRWQLKEDIVISVYKKGDKTDCSNYRGMSLPLTSYKILSIVFKVKSRHR
jgi:hypothetical protein